MHAILAIETSSPVLSVALKKQNDKIVEEALPGFLMHAENLLPIIARLLKKKKVSVDHLDTLLIGRGPGSFTGLRIGFATLKGLIAIKKRKCLGALSPDLIAQNISLPEKSNLMVSLDAFRSKIYSRLYLRKKGQWVPKGKIQILSLEEFIKALPDACSLVGSAVSRYGNEIKKKAAGKKIHFLPEDQGYPKASALISLHEQKKSSVLEPLQKPKDFIPLYFRLSEAEEMKKSHANTR